MTFKMTYSGPNMLLFQTCKISFLNINVFKLMHVL
jgi:hypothetical protein